MAEKKYILAIDQGTSATKTLIFDDLARPVAKGSAALKTHYLEDGFVEQDPEAIFQNVRSSVEKCLAEFNEKGLSAANLCGIGISNQRETFVIWDQNGRPLHRAVVWQCKRSAGVCETLRERGLEALIHQKTGLVVDPYFSATKLIWLNEHNAEIRAAIQSGNAFFGTIDTWLLYRFTNGKCYATDYTNASRTMLFNLHTLSWDAELIEIFDLTGIRLPQIKASSSFFGETNLDGLLSSPLSIAGMIGDSHAAAFGEGCFDPGTAKATLGTGCSILMNIGSQPVFSKNGMVTTICWSMDGRVDYALEGVIVSCGATIEWLKNEFAFFSEHSETETMASQVADNGGVCLIPAFSGLGSPHWQMLRRASLTGLSFATTKNHIVRAALESVAYQIMDVITAMEKDAGINLKALNADGGISANAFVMQFTADLLNKAVNSTGMPDVSALGAALMAGLKTGVFQDIDALRRLDGHQKTYPPYENNNALKGYRQWQNTIVSGI